MIVKTVIVCLVAWYGVACAQEFPRGGGSPEWVNDAVFYQIFPERFANGDPGNDPRDVEPWNGTPTLTNYFGGDLKGILDHLDYLQDLGVNALYLTPIFESPTNHKYHTTDYLAIDRHFGDEKLFKELLDACHARKMRVVLDGVFNHTGRGFFAFADLVKNGAASHYRDWYNIQSFPVGPPEKPNYDTWMGLGDLPKLMTGNPEVRSYLFEATRRWTALGIDGWRLDGANEIPHEFWIAWRSLVKGLNPDAYVVGEIWDDASSWLKGDQFDAVMNYRFRGACVGFISLENRTAGQFDSILAATRGSYPSGVNYVMQNILGSHDTERFLTLAENDVNKVKLAALVQMTYIGAPMIYYGDEVGMTGGRDPDCRKPMVWDTTRWNAELRTWYRTLIGLRNRHPVFRRGSFRTALADSPNKIFAFVREDETQTAVVILNVSTEPQRIPAAVFPHASQRWTDVLRTEAIDVTHGVVVAPRAGMVLMNGKGN